MLLQDSYQEFRENAFCFPDIREALKGIFPPEYRYHRVAMLRAYLDASKTFPGQNKFPSLVIAGFVADVDAWGEFDAKWREIRAAAGIDYFHMADFKYRVKPYDSWDCDKRTAVISKLIKLIQDHVEFGVAVAFPKSEFDAISYETRKRFNDNPYNWVALTCIKLIAARVHEEVLYVFEAGDTGEGEFRDAMTRLMAQSDRYRKENKIYSLMPGYKGKFPALDTADFLAWEIAQIPEMSPSVRPTLREIFDTVEIENAYIGKAEIEALRDREETLDVVKMLAKEYGVRLGKPPIKKPYRW